MKKQGILYGIADRNLGDEKILEALSSGLDMIQLREKNISSLDFYRQSVEVKKVTEQYHVPFIINDRVDIAIAVNADGVHIGQSDIPAAIARDLIGTDMLLGVSAASVKEAVQAANDGADYLGVGAMFPTGTKTDANYVSIEELKKIRHAVNLPIIAIGGINKGNIKQFHDTGINGLAVVSAIIAQPDIQKAAAEMKSMFYKEVLKHDL